MAKSRRRTLCLIQSGRCDGCCASRLLINFLLWSLRVDLYVTTDFGLAGQYVALGLVLVSKCILDRHAYLTRKKLHTAGRARPRAAGAVDEHANFVRNIQNGSIGSNRCGRVGSL